MICDILHSSSDFHLQIFFRCILTRAIFQRLLFTSLRAKVSSFQDLRFFFFFLVWRKMHVFVLEYSVPKLSKQSSNLWLIRSNALQVRECSEASRKIYVSTSSIVWPQTLNSVWKIIASVNLATYFKCNIT